MATRTSSARLSTISGAPSLQPSLASSNASSSNNTSPTTNGMMHSNNSNSNNRSSARFSQATTLNPDSHPNNNNNNSNCGRTTTSSANSNNHRASTYYASHPLTSTASTTSLAPEHPKSQDIQSWTGALSRMQDSRLERQRYVMSSGKGEEVAKLALGAKLDKALGRRYRGQDAVFSAGAAAGGRARDGEKI